MNEEEDIERALLRDNNLMGGENWRCMRGFEYCDGGEVVECNFNVTISAFISCADPIRERPRSSGTDMT